MRTEHLASPRIKFSKMEEAGPKNKDSPEEGAAIKKYREFKSGHIAKLKRSKLGPTHFIYMAECFEAMLSELGIAYGSEWYERLAADFFPGFDFSIEPTPALVGNAPEAPENLEQ